MRNFIIGTDWWTDCDDAVAMRLAARAHKAGEIRLLGVGINACMEYSAPSLGAFLKLEGAEDIPVGIDRSADERIGEPSYQKTLARYPSAYRSNDDAEDAVRMYRRLLAAADGPVEIAEIGFQLIPAALLDSRPDDISGLSGMDLVREKVSKFWMMAGKWDENPGTEFNFARTARSRQAGASFCAKCPVPVTFLGWEIGAGVVTGGELDHGDFLWQALKDHGSENGRMSWDPMLVELALIGDERAAGYDFVQGFASVDDATGQNRFCPDAAGPHRYVVKMLPDEVYRNRINEKIR